MVDGGTAIAVPTGFAAVATAFLETAVLRMIPYSVPAVVIIFLDLIYGIKAARCRGEKVRLSTAIRRSMTKIVSYVCWLILATTIAISFHKDWLEWAVLGLVYGNEFASIVGNYLEVKGIDFRIDGLYRYILRVISGKVGEPMHPGEAEEIIKPKERKRDAKTGRFVKSDRREPAGRRNRNRRDDEQCTGCYL